MSFATWDEIVSDWPDYHYMMTDVDYSSFIKFLKNERSCDLSINQEVVYICIVYYINDMYQNAFELSETDREILMKCASKNLNRVQLSNIEILLDSYFSSKKEASDQVDRINLEVIKAVDEHSKNCS